MDCGFKRVAVCKKGGTRAAAAMQKTPLSRRPLRHRPNLHRYISSCIGPIATQAHSALPSRAQQSPAEPSRAQQSPGGPIAVTLDHHDHRRHSQVTPRHPDHLSKAKEAPSRFPWTTTITAGIRRSPPSIPQKPPADSRRPQEFLESAALPPARRYLHQHLGGI